MYLPWEGLPALHLQHQLLARQFCNSFIPHSSRALDRCEISLQTRVVSPLCWGEIYGYFIVEPAIKFMNSKARSCSLRCVILSGPIQKSGRIQGLNTLSGYMRQDWKRRRAKNAALSQNLGKRVVKKALSQ